MRMGEGPAMRFRTVINLWPGTFWRAVSLAAAIMVCALPQQRAQAGELAAFNEAFAGAWGHYRQAVFYGRTGNAAVAALELDAFTAKWSALVARFGDDRPDAVAGDTAWQETLQSIGATAGQGLEQLDAGDLEAAKTTLAPIREIAGEMRRRNGVAVYSDHVDELSAAMDVLAGYRREIKDLGGAEAVARVTRQAAVVAYLFEKCDARAPAATGNDPEFRRLIDGARESTGKLWAALETGDIRLYRIAIGELRSYERILFLRFG